MQGGCAWLASTLGGRLRGVKSPCCCAQPAAQHGLPVPCFFAACARLQSSCSDWDDSCGYWAEEVSEQKLVIGSCLRLAATRLISVPALWLSMKSHMWPWPIRHQWQLRQYGASPKIIPACQMLTRVTTMLPLRCRAIARTAISELLAACCPLPAAPACCLLPTACCLLPAACCLRCPHSLCRPRCPCYPCCLCCQGLLMPVGPCMCCHPLSSPWACHSPAAAVPCPCHCLCFPSPPKCCHGQRWPLCSLLVLALICSGNCFGPTARPHMIIVPSLCACL